MSLLIGASSGLQGAAGASAGGGGDLGETIQQSLRFRNDSGVSAQYLHNTSLAGHQLSNYTISVWLKRGNFTNASARYIITSGDTTTSTGGGNNVNKLSFNHDGSTPGFVFRDAGGNTYSSTQPLHRDFAAWYHVVAQRDHSAGTVKLYVNGTVIGSASATGAPGLFNQSGDNAVLIGLYADPDYGSSGWNGYMAEFNFLESKLEPTDFGRTNEDGVWVPKDLSGLTSDQYGAKGFRLKFDSSAGLGDDSAPTGGNHASANDFTAVGFDTTALSASNEDNDIDYKDTPTSNYGILNPVQGNSINTIEANLSTPASSACTTADHYPVMEVSQNFLVEMFDQTPTAGIGNPGVLKLVTPDGTQEHTVIPSLYTPNQIGYAIDITNRATYAYDITNGAWLNGSTGTTNANVNSGNTQAQVTWTTGQLPTKDRYLIKVTGNQGSVNTSANRYNFGQRAYIMPEPSGFVAVQTNNLPEPTIKDGKDHFRVILGPGSNSIGSGEVEAGSYINPTGFLDNNFTYSPDKGFDGSTSTQTYVPRSPTGDYREFIVFDEVQTGTTIRVNAFVIGGKIFANGTSVSASSGWVDVSSACSALGGLKTLGFVSGGGQGGFGAIEIDGNILVQESILNDAQDAFSNGLYWIKDRQNNSTQHQFVDTGNGVSNAHQCPNATTLQSYSAPSGSSVAWCWKSGTEAANTDGNSSTTVNVSANTDAGFSVIRYTGNNTAGHTVGHGLNSTPEFVIHKGSGSSENWKVFHVSKGAGHYLNLNGIGSVANNQIWNNVGPTSTVLTMGAGQQVNAASVAYTAYAWHSVEGYSKFGTYTGNGSTDGVYVHLGFKPALLMLKLSGSTSGDWIMVDSTRDLFNPVGLTLFPNSTNDEDPNDQYSAIDFLSDGFKHRNSQGSRNSNNTEYIYCAWAESPFGGLNAPPATAR